MTSKTTLGPIISAHLPITQIPITSDFRSHVEGGWRCVDANVRARMDRLLTSQEPTTFEGIGCVRRSKIGWVFAHLSRMFGSPLIYDHGTDVKTTVSIVPTGNGLRCWHRKFQFSDGTMREVKTTKMASDKFGLMDGVGDRGQNALATKMRIWSSGKSLCFQSTGYVLRFRRFTVAIPAFLTPGTLHAEHTDIDGETFRYTLSFRHPLWGETFYQSGLFRQIS